MSEPTFEEVCARMGIDPELQKHVAKDAPIRGKMAVARAMLPAPPKVLLSMIYILVGDANAKVREAAEQSLLSMPAERLRGSLDRKTHPKILEFLVYRRLEEADLMEAMVLLRQLNDKTICFLAQHGKGRVAEIIANNHERLIITPQVIHFLDANPEAGPALVDRVRSFQRLYDIIPDPPPEPVASSAPASASSALGDAQPAPPAQGTAGVSADDPPADGSEEVGLAAAAAEAPESTGWGQAGSERGVSVTEMGYAMPMTAAPDHVTMPPEFVVGEVYLPPPPPPGFVPIAGLINPLQGLFGAWGIAHNPNFLAPPDSAGAPILDASAASLAQASTAPKRGPVELSLDISEANSLGENDFSFGFDEDDEDFEGDLVDERDRKDEDADARSKKAISDMKVGEKIKLAYKGNKSVREFLVRDTNKVVATAVIKSGRITDSEVLSVATNRSIHEEVIRELSMNREYLRRYPVKVALANNPKTPIPTAITLLSGLHIKDLKLLSNNRNVSSAVFTAATRLYKQKRQMQQ